MNFLKRVNIAIDLGTANTLIFKEGAGVVLNSPSVIAFRSDRGRTEVVALGSEAEAMLGKTPPNISAVRPLKDGVIADYKATELMLKDLGLSQQAAEAVDADTPMGARALELYRQFVEEEDGKGRDFSAMLPRFAARSRS